MILIQILQDVSVLEKPINALRKFLELTNFFGVSQTKLKQWELMVIVGVKIVIFGDLMFPSKISSYIVK